MYELYEGITVQSLQEQFTKSLSVCVLKLEHIYLDIRYHKTQTDILDRVRKPIKNRRDHIFSETKMKTNRQQAL